MEQFTLTAKNAPVQQAVVQFCDTEAPLVLTVVADIDEDGVLTETEKTQEDILTREELVEAVCRLY